MPSNSLLDRNISSQCTVDKFTSFIRSKSLEYLLSNAPRTDEYDSLKKLLVRQSSEAAEFKIKALTEISRLQEALAAESGDHAATACAFQHNEDAQIELLKQQLAETRQHVTIMTQHYNRLKDAFIKLANEIVRIRCHLAENKQSVQHLECQLTKMSDQRQLFADQLRDIECRLVWSSSCASQKQVDYQKNFDLCQRLLTIGTSLLNVLNEMETRLVEKQWSNSGGPKVVAQKCLENICPKSDEEEECKELNASDFVHEFAHSPSSCADPYPAILPPSETTQDEAHSTLEPDAGRSHLDDTASQPECNPMVQTTRPSQTLPSRKHAPRFCRYQSCDNINPDQSSFMTNEFCREMDTNIQKAEFTSVTLLPRIKPTQISTASLLCNPRPVIVRRESYKPTRKCPDTDPLNLDQNCDNHNANPSTQADLELICKGALGSDLRTHSLQETNSQDGFIFAEPLTETRLSLKNRIDKSRLFRISRVWRSFRSSGKENSDQPSQTPSKHHNSVLSETKVQQYK